MANIFTIMFMVLFTLSLSAQSVDTTNQKSLLTAFYNENSLLKKQSLYDELVKQFPEKSTKAASDYDDLRRVLAMNYLIQGDSTQFYKLIDGIHAKQTLPAYLDRVAGIWGRSDKSVNQALTLSATSMKVLQDVARQPARFKPADISLTKWRHDNAEQQKIFTVTYARILFKKGDAKAALDLVRPLYKINSSENPELTTFYGTLLAANGQPKDALAIIENLVEQGYRSENLLLELKKTYLAVNGPDSNFDDFYQKLELRSQVKLKEMLRSKMVLKPAPPFTLLDTEKKPVSLQDFKGKVIIIDFWATWCVPCRETFPAMQMAVNKYKDNSDVKFLFIDTRENEKTYKKLVQDYLTQTKYPFHVLFDEVSKSGKQSKIAEAYQGLELPTRFIIDKKGYIRFKELGFENVGNEIAVQKLATMIELASAN